MSSPAHNLQQSTHSNLLAIRQVCLQLNLNPNTGSDVIANLRNRLIGRGTHAVSVSIMKLSANEHGWASHHLHIRGIERKKKLLRSSVMMGLLPLTQLTKSDTLMPVIQEVFNCYRYLYKGAQIIHHDINPSNIMYWEDDNKKYGVLIDFDFSLPLSRQRMGTMPYMAIDLLQPIPTKHLYRHDLESLLYVLFVIATRYAGGKEINDPPLRLWFHSTPRSLRLEKIAFLTGVPALPTSAFECMEDLLHDMMQMFYTGFIARTSHNKSTWRSKKNQALNQAIPNVEFDDETLGGNVNFDKFQTILNSI